MSRGGGGAWDPQGLSIMRNHGKSMGRKLACRVDLKLI